MVLSVADDRKLLEARPNLRDYLLGGPKVDDFEIERPKDHGCEIDL